MLDLWFVKVNSFQISKVDAILCKPQNRKLGSEWGRMWTLGHHVWRWTLFRLRMWMPYCANPQNRKPGSEWRRMCTVGQPEWIRHPFRFRFWRPYCANRKTGNSEVNWKHHVHMRPVCLKVNSLQSLILDAILCKPQNRKFGSARGPRCACTSLLDSFAKTCGSSCLGHGDEFSSHFSGGVQVAQVRFHKNRFSNQSAHGGASLKSCQNLTFLWIGVLFCMAALCGCVALSTLWRLFNFKIFLRKFFRPFLWGSPMSIFHLSWGGGTLFARF